MAGGGQQHQRAVAHHIQRLGKGRQGGIIGGLRADLVPFQSGQLDVAAQEAAQLQPGRIEDHDRVRCGGHDSGDPEIAQHPGDHLADRPGRVRQLLL